MDDPAVLALRGRLLKDSARTSGSAPDRRRLYREAGDAYARAGAVDGSTYPLINAASLARLAGDQAEASERAGAVLDRGDDPDETPYYQAATRAEALLLLGRVDEAKAALAEAVARAPRAWEDHASTLRQFRLILAETGGDADWVDILRPPRCLHFAGHMALEADAQVLERSIREVLEREQVGFGFGALAAGADIVIAEALLERGAELHLMLPTERDAFKGASVAGFGPEWETRFEAVIARAETVRAVGPSRDAPGRAEIELAAEVAMGAAAMKARVLLTEAVQLLVLDGDAPEAGVSGLIASVWAPSGRRQHRLVSPRHGGAGPFRPEPSGADRPCAMLSVQFAGGVEAPSGLAEAVDSGSPPLWPPRWSGERLLLAYAGPADAATAAERIARSGDLRVGGHYALVQPAEDPFGGPPRLLGAEAGLAEQIAATAPPGAIHLSGDFAFALHAGAGEGLHTEYVGDLPAEPGEEAVPLYALRSLTGRAP